jgi:TonB family protein
MRIIHKALGISVLIHLAVMVSWVVFPSFSAKKVYTPVYQVSLVTQPEPPREEEVQRPQARAPTPEEKAVQPPPKPPPPPKESAIPEKKPAPPVKKKRETEVRKKEATEERTLKDVEKRIDAIRKKMASSKESQEQRTTVSARVLDAKRNAYFDAIAAHVQANWSLLKNQMENMGTLTTDIGLQIRRDGTVTMIVIEKPSGNALFDEFAMRAVKRSNPLPPFPEELREDRLEVTIGLSS